VTGCLYEQIKVNFFSLTAIAPTIDCLFFLHILPCSHVWLIFSFKNMRFSSLSSPLAPHTSPRVREAPFHGPGWFQKTPPAVPRAFQDTLLGLLPTWSICTPLPHCRQLASLSGNSHPSFPPYERFYDLCTVSYPSVEFMQVIFTRISSLRTPFFPREHDKLIVQLLN